MIALEITIPIPSEWPTSDELDRRNAVETALNAAAVGICTGAGGGMGQMHLTYRVDTESALPAARTVVDEAMTRLMPGSRYEVTTYDET